MSDTPSTTPKDARHPLVAGPLDRLDERGAEDAAGIIDALEGLGFEIRIQIVSTYDLYDDVSVDYDEAEAIARRLAYPLAEGFTRVLTFDDEDGDDVIWDVRPTTPLARVILRGVESEDAALAADAAPGLLDACERTYIALHALLEGAEPKGWLEAVKSARTAIATARGVSE